MERVVVRAVFAVLLLFAVTRAEAADGYFAVTPCRLVDTRLAADAPALSANVPRFFQTAGKCGVPADATAVSMTVTAVSPGSFGHLIVYPGNQNSNFTSAVNFTALQNRANHGIWKLGSGGFKVYAAGANYNVHFVADVDGYFSSSNVEPPGSKGPLDYHPVRECRVYDTRLGEPMLTGGELRPVSVKGVCGIPELSAVAAVQLHAVWPNAVGHMKMYASDAVPPGPFSNLNISGDALNPRVTTNGAFTQLGANSPGDVTVNFTGYNANPPQTHVILDATGYFRRTGANAPGLRYVPMDGCRAVDTRSGAPVTNSRYTYDLSATAPCTVPIGAKAVMANITVATPSGQGYLIAHAAGDAEPLMSTINFWENDPAVSSASIVRLDANARMEVLPRIYGTVPGSAHLIIDVFGYFVEGCDPAQTFCIEALSSAQVHPNTAKGGVANTPFHDADVDRINLFNGNLSINIPLGLTYPVGPSLSYGFGLAYNSNMWRTHESDGTPEPDQQFNAGLGWQLTHGRLYAPFSRPPDDNRWVYVSPDGSEHIFFETSRDQDADEPEDQQASGYQAQTWLYTRDNTFLRLVHKKASTNAHFPPSNNAYQSRVEFPNGEIHFFDAQGRPVEIRDRFGPVSSPDNWIRFDYGTSGRTRITDSWGREHLIHHSMHSSFPQTIDRLEMASVGGQKNVVTFTYDDELIYRPCQTFGDLRVTVPLLQRIDFSPDNDPGTPNEWHYAMEDYALSEVGNTGSTCRSSGALERLRLPTGGKLQWTYVNASFPQSSSTRRFFQRSNSVATRSTLTAGNAPIGTWTYTREGATTADFSESVTSMRDPLGNVTKSYFSVWARGEDSVEGWSEKDYALPFTRKSTRLDPTDAPGLFLSTEVFEAGQTTPVRTTWVKYDRDTIGAAAIDAKKNLNARVIAERTVYEDDCDSGSGPGCVHRFKSAAYTGWDTLGHFRTATLDGNFSSANYELTERNYNPGGRPAITEPWVLNTFTFARVDAGVGNQAYARFTFDTSTGELISKAVHYSGGAGTTPGRDIITTFNRPAGNRGFAAGETISGGDIPSSYTKSYGWTCGVLATSQMQGASFFSLNQVVDCSSGLVTSARDVANQQTTFGYDLTGRRTLIRPPGEADLVTSYVFATGSPVVSRITDVRKSGATELQKSERELDELGRLRSEIRYRSEVTAGGGLSSKRDVQRRTYDANGNVATISTWNDIGVANPTTTRYRQYDAFGRAREVLKPDGGSIAISHAGEFSRTTIVGVGRSFSSTGVLQQMGASKTEKFDRRGRLWKVTEQGEDAPNGTDTVRCGAGAGFSTNIADCNTDTTYLYDEGGRLTRISVGTDRGTQTRHMRYDPRGFLDWESHPELSPISVNPDGTEVDITYGDYNALGSAGKRRDAETLLDYVYDGFGRLSQIEEDQGATSRLLTKLRYGTNNSDRSNGRLIEATRYNYRPIGTTNYVIAITENMQYLGVGGRISSVTLKAPLGVGISHTAADGATPNEVFTTSFTWNNLGLPSRIDYPQCNFTQAQCNSFVMPARSVTNEYRDGILVGIPGFTGETVPGGGSGSGITYHPNGLWKSVAHASGAVYTQVNDPDGMTRPYRYDLTRQGTTASIGPYVYDEAGNPVKIGTEKHLYDLTARVWKSQMDDGVNGQEYRYDGFGNIQSIVSGVLANNRATPTSFATNRLNGATYDGNGRMTSWNGRQYRYDAAGALASVTIPTTASWPGETWHYMYTAGGERVWAHGEAINRPRRDRWTLRGLNNEVLREYNSEGYTGWGNAKDYIWRNGRQLLSSASATEGVRHFYADHLGSTRLITDASGNSIPYMFSFLPFGEQFSVLSPPAEPTTRFERQRFAGHERDIHDPTSYADDLDNMHARQHNPLLGRFLTVDPLPGSVDSPQSWNRYAYALNRPTLLRDPDGRASGVDYNELSQKIGPLSAWVWVMVDSPIAQFEKGVIGAIGGTIAFVGGVATDVLLTATGTRFTGDVEQNLQSQAASAMMEWGGPHDSSPRIFPVTAIVTSWLPKYFEFAGWVRSESHVRESDLKMATEAEKWEVSFVPTFTYEEEITVTTTFEEIPLVAIPQRTFNLIPIPLQ